ncbi:DBH-like monooxygenase protein 1 [Orbicella faveolata]|uniref:DBH-like monooxygenase protein 1 n=1 Tax=Orbicella faveolata TaxID=48498 RepID=UPI0009E3D4A0|nr:DBH-like monooxygenase protein 1 [Orbicella faveolata]
MQVLLRLYEYTTRIKTELSAIVLTQDDRGVTIPKKQTTYWCSLIKAPEINTKHHITKFEPYVQEGNEGLVHHLLIYECHGKFNQSLYGSGFDCHNTANMPLTQCYHSSVVAAWAVGGEAFYYPPKAGYPIGTADSPSSYMLELHYDNPDGVEGHNDSSGVRFYYTSNLREYDAGIFAVGESVSPFMIIPPKQESWMTVGYCSKECYKQNLNSTKLPEKGIKVFAALLHTHLQGRATWTKHVRDGVELPEIARDDNYDFNFQVIIAVLYGSVNDPRTANDPQIEPQMILGPVSRKLP